MRREAFVCVVLSIILLAGCSKQDAKRPEGGDPTPALEASGAVTAVVPALPPTFTPAPTATATLPPAPILSYLPVLYEDEEGRFILYYPSGWNEGFGERQSRGYFRQLLGWDTTSSASIENRPAGASYLQITVYTWEPIGDLDAYLAQRQPGRAGSGNRLLSAQELTVDGLRAVAFIVQPEVGGEPFFVFLMAIGDRYLELSGSGDYQLLAEIATTVRVLPGE